MTCGIEENKHESKKLRLGRGPVGKAAVVGLRERGGRVVAHPIRDLSANGLQAAVYKHVEPGSIVHTDEAGAYADLGGLFYQHATVNHSDGEYVRGNVTVNGIESVWAALKRGILGVYHHVTPKHLGRCMNEFTFRLNDGDVKRHTLERLDSMLALTVGKRLTFAELIA